MKKIILLFVTIILLISLCACGRTYKEAENNMGKLSGDYFVVIKEWGSGIGYGYSYIVYASDTKVMYYIEYGGDSRMITPLYNADGTLQIYEGEIK